MRLLKLEEAILAWISERHSSLGPHLAAIDVAKREYTGAGLYTYLSSGASLLWDRSPIDGPIISSAQLPEGGGSILWLSQGRPHCLEIYAFGDQFPENLDDFELSRSDGSV
jgi:hypothetical protein